MRISSIGGRSRRARRLTRRLPGFSLMEMLIVTALFSLSILVISQTFASFNQLHRKIANRAIVNQDLRFVMEMLVRAARNRPVSYATEPASRASELRLEYGNGQLMILKQSGPNDVLCGDTPPVGTTLHCLLLSTDSGVTWVPVSAKRVDVSRFDVYVRPSVSPFELAGADYANDTQPYVTFVVGMTYLADRSKERETLQAQTTVSSRVYRR